MASLYEIDQEIMNCIDPETGEIVDLDRLEDLQMKREQKIENVALWIKNLKADAAAYKAEKDAFAAREKQAKEKAESLSKWLTRALNGQNFWTGKCAVSFRKSESVEIVDPDIVPEDYLTVKIQKAPDKIAIKDAIKHNVKIPGCQLVTNQNIQIK